MFSFAMKGLKLIISRASYNYEKASYDYKMTVCFLDQSLEQNIWSILHDKTEFGNYTYSLIDGNSYFITDMSRKTCDRMRKKILKLVRGSSRD